jgi:hypothetical protein
MIASKGDFTAENAEKRIHRRERSEGAEIRQRRVFRQDNRMRQDEIQSAEL